MSDPFERMYRDMAAEEARLRRMAEERARDLAAVLREVATRLAPEQVDALQRENPAALRSLSPEMWRSLFTRIRVPPTDGWIRNNGYGIRRVRDLERRAAALRAEVERLKEENARLRKENARPKRAEGAGPPPKNERGEAFTGVQVQGA